MIVKGVQDDETRESNVLVMVADDDDDLREAIVGVLHQHGYRTLPASDGQQALEGAVELRPDVMLLDYRMPKKLGTEVLQELRDRGVVAPTIFMTAARNMTAITFELDRGQASLLTKPFTLDQLVDLIECAVVPDREDTDSHAPDG